MEWSETQTKVRTDQPLLVRYLLTTQTAMKFLLSHEATTHTRTCGIQVLVKFWSWERSLTILTTAMLLLSWSWAILLEGMLYTTWHLYPPHFLARKFNKGSIYITRERTNRGTGYGLELSCIYRLYSPKGFVDRLKQKVENLWDRGLLPRSIDHWNSDPETGIFSK